MICIVPCLLCQCCQKCQSARLRAFSTSVFNWSPARNSDYYALLGIKHDATLEEVKQAFFSKSKKLHPDSDPANPTLHSQFVKLNEAYRVLSKESSRRHYDNLRTTERAWPTSGGHQGSPFSSAEFGARSESQPNENIRYWQQFHGAPAESHSGPEVERKRRRSRRLFGYCLLIMLGSLAVHYVGFRKLEEVHNTFMDEKDRAITQIYNESKDRARSRSLEEQQELLRQKHAEFTQRYHILHKRLPEAAVAKEPSPPASAAK